jgi:DNA repair exonuclease SbcCD nuclease subunit
LSEKQIYDNFHSWRQMLLSGKSPDVLVHAGDLFDTVRPRTRAYTTVPGAPGRLHAAGIPLVIIAGNHRLHPV